PSRSGEALKAMSDPGPWADLPELLHDARLLSLGWDPELARLTLLFACLRREVDGSDLADRTVEIASVEAIVVAQDSCFPNVRPPESSPSRLLGVEDLSSWPFGPQEALLRVNSNADEDEALHAARESWLLGDLRPLRACRLRVSLRFDHTSMLGL